MTQPLRPRSQVEREATELASWIKYSSQEGLGMNQTTSLHQNKRIDQEKVKLAISGAVQVRQNG